MLTNEGLREYSRKNKLPLSLNHIATQDYLASRCCLLNGFLPQGYILAEQAIEKSLKSILLLLDPLCNVKKYRGHRLQPIIQKIQEYDDIGLTKYQKFANELSNIYELSRYPDNRLQEAIKTYGMSSKMIDDLDELFFFLSSVSPIPDEMKFRSGLYVILFDDSINANIFPMKSWAIKQNKKYIELEQDLRARYLEVDQHLFRSNDSWFYHL